ncbi:MAG TPA: hypothetical protein VFM93_12565 [Candidatus Limnocylindria bacterium]|nr:hypothetical protein [Candidatus Limnocylindria bacterium]
MSGRSDRTRALAGLVLLATSLTGAALAAPVGVLEITDGATRCGGPLADGGALEYAYTQSIYLAPVTEELERRGARLVVRRVRSTDPRAVEYFRWEGQVRREDGGFVQDAPSVEVERLVIRISPEYGQRIATADWSCDLKARFGGAVVTATPVHRPAAFLP